MQKQINNSLVVKNHAIQEQSQGQDLSVQGQYQGQGLGRQGQGQDL